MLAAKPLCRSVKSRRRLAARFYFVSYGNNGKLLAVRYNAYQLQSRTVYNIIDIAVKISFYKTVCKIIYNKP